jgi:hypothetical protein
LCVAGAHYIYINTSLFENFSVSIYFQAHLATAAAIPPPLADVDAVQLPAAASAVARRQKSRGGGRVKINPPCRLTGPPIFGQAAPFAMEKNTPFRVIDVMSDAQFDSNPSIVIADKDQLINFNKKFDDVQSKETEKVGRYFFNLRFKFTVRTLRWLRNYSVR